MDTCEAFWVLKQLHKELSLPEHLINIRCIHNCRPYRDPDTGRQEKRTEITFDEHIRVDQFKQRWYSDLWNNLLRLNSTDGTKPSNIYFAVNPLKTKGHKKDNFEVYHAFYLDLDDNKKYTKEQRWLQIYYWCKLGFAPSFVIDSGHGYHVYWIFTRPLARETGELLLKRMVRLSDCRDGGNTFDISRVLRLPGFKNVKEWSTDNTPPCGIVYPRKEAEAADNWWDLDLAARYDPLRFEHFPPSALTDLERYYSEARRISKTPEELSANIDRMIHAAAVAAQESAVNTAGQTAAAQAQPGAAGADKAADEKFTARLTLVPPVEELKWPQGGSWMKKYCKVGHAGLTAGDLDELKMKLNTDDVSASELDFRIIYVLARKGYTKDAVRNFWIRAEHKLWRQDKEQRNPNYFDMSYDKALSYVQAAIDQNTPALEARKSEVFVDNFQTFVRNDKSAECVLTAELRLNKIYVDRDAISPIDKQWYDLTAICIDPAAEKGTTAYQMFVPNKAFNTIAAFKEYTDDLLRVTTNNNAQLSKVAQFLLSQYRNVPTTQFHSKIRYHEKKFHFPSYIISKDAITYRTDTPVIEAFATRYPFFNSFNTKIAPKEAVAEKLRTYWEHTLKMHIPQLVSSVLGFIAGVAIQPIMAQDLATANFHVPTLNIRGSSHTAKTETVKHLCTVTGMDYNNAGLSVQTSSFALQRLMDMTNCVPLMVDEFKEERDNQKQISHIRDLVRRIYSGEQMYRGRPDLGVTVIKLHGALLIVGEHALERQGDIAETSRVFVVDTSVFEPEKHIAAYSRIEHLRWCELGPYFYQFLLQQDAKTLFAEYQNLRERILVKIQNYFAGEKMRVSHNIAVICYGCELWDRFVQSLAPGVATLQNICDPEATLVKMICDETVSSGQSIIHTEGTNGNEKIIVTSKNEALQMIQTFGEMLCIKDKIISEMESRNVMLYEERGEELLINMTTLYEAYFEHCAKFRGIIVPQKNKMTQLFKAALHKKELWIISAGTTRSVRNNHSHVMLFNLHVLRAMKVWPAKALLPHRREEPTNVSPFNRTGGLLGSN